MSVFNTIYLCRNTCLPPNNCQSSYVLIFKIDTEVSSLFHTRVQFNFIDFLIPASYAINRIN